MKQVVISRITDTGKETLGTLSFMQNDGHLFVCKTLELPWKGNQSGVSCIPAGTYTCRYTRSAHFSTPGHDVFTYEVENVPHRAGIRIHSANFFNQLLGCIALGGALQDMNGDGQKDATESRSTVHAFENQLNREPFTLIIHGLPAV